MSEQPRVRELLQRWQTLNEQGQAVSVEELCADCPNLSGELDRQIRALASLEGERPSIALSGPGHTLPLLPAEPGEEKGGQPHRTIAGYEILGELGRGGMGIVYKARQPGLGRVVALKMILTTRHGGAGLATRFQAEARAIARLRHPNIVQVYEVGEHEGQAFFSLEYVEGGSLDKFLAGQPQPPRQSAKLLETLARAVHYAHEQGIVHRDLKPANILLACVGSESPPAAPDSSPLLPALIPKITDFGLAKHLDVADGPTLSGTILGTPAYMAPEQAEGRTHAIGPATDVYALGALLYELLTGKAPFRGNSVLDVLEKVRTQEPEAPARGGARIHRDLETICLKCLQKEPHRRYASARELADDLARFLQGEPIRARPVGPGGRLARWCRRNPALAVLAAVSAAALLVVGVGGVVMKSISDARRAAETLAASEAKARRAAERAEALQRALADTRQYHALLGGIRHRVAERPPGWTWACLEEVAKAARLKKERDPVELRTEAGTCLAGVDVRWKFVWDHPFTTGPLAFRPDGKVLAAAQFKAPAWLLPCSVFLIDPESGQTLRTLSFEPDRLWSVGKKKVQDGAWCVAYSPDGKRLAVGSRSGWVHCWDLTREKAGPVSWKANSEGCVDQLAFSADGRSLFAKESAKILARWDVGSGGKVRARFKARGTPIDGIAVSPDGKVLACSCDGRLHLLDAEKLRPVRAPLPFRTHLCCFHPDGRVLAFVDAGAIVLADVQSGKVVRRLRTPEREVAHRGRIHYLQFAAGGSLLLSASRDDEARNARLWESASGRLLATHVAAAALLTGAALSPDGRCLATGSDSKLVFHEVAGQTVQTFLAHHALPVKATGFSPDGKSLGCVTGREATLWDLATGELRGLHQLSRNLDVPTLAFHPRGTDLAWAGDPEVIWTWELTGKGKVKEFLVRGVGEIAFAPGGDRLWGVAGEDRVLSWRWPGGEEVSAWQNESLEGLSGIRCLAVGTEWVLAGGRDGNVSLLRARDGKYHRFFPGPGSPVQSVAFGPGEGIAAFGTQGGVVRLVRLPGGEPLQDLKDHHNSVEAVAFSRDGGLLATGSQDRTVRLYQRAGETFVPLMTLRTRTMGPVRSVGFRPDGCKLAVLADGESAVRLWHLDELRERLEEMGLGFRIAD